MAEIYVRKRRKRITEEMDKELVKNVIDFNPTVRGGKAYGFFKRLFDICASFLGIIIFFPVMFIIGVIIIFHFNGNAVYVDRRVGKGGKSIGVLKFRTMRRDANKNVHEYLDEEQMEEYHKERKVKNDPRVTKFGRFLRNSSLDELPQLFNILVGHLSFVGPRAVTQREIDRNYTDEQAEALLQVRPGWTGSWCAYGRYKASYSNGERQRIELEYLAQRSVGKDLKIIFATVGSLFVHDDGKTDAVTVEDKVDGEQNSDATEVGGVKGDNDQE